MEIKDNETQNPAEESASEKDVETKKTPQENNQDQPLETEDESSSLAVPEDESHEAPPDTNCKCMQKKPGGKYFCLNWCKAGGYNPPPYLLIPKSFVKRFVAENVWQLINI